jgi:hypothetical protein
MTRHINTLITVVALTFALSSTAAADSNGIATLGIGAGVVHTSAPGELGETSTAAQIGVRTKLLYIFGLDFSLASARSTFESGQSIPRYRMSALLYLMNMNHFGLFASAGMASGQINDLFNIDGDTTYLRAGGGTEISIRDHYAIALEGYWMVPGLGMMNQNLNNSLNTTGLLPNPEQALPLNGYEISVGIRYFF